MKKTFGMIFLAFSITMFMTFGTLHIVFNHNERLRDDPSLENYMAGPLLAILGVSFGAASVIMFALSAESKNIYCVWCNRIWPRQPYDQCPDCNSWLIDTDRHDSFS